jgi:hypothetical protein
MICIFPSNNDPEFDDLNFHIDFIQELEDNVETNESISFDYFLLYNWLCQRPVFDYYVFLSVWRSKTC